MPEEKTHDLRDFIQQIGAEMAAEYNRIQKRATEDSGTAGDQGEENWAELLRDWLPRTFEVVTKGRIIGQDGTLSRQVDVVVLNGAYPKKLLSKKLYLAGGVAAVFECKVTLRASHIAEAVENCAIIKNMHHQVIGTPYRELHSPIFYGLLAHSHSWKGDKSTPVENIHQKLWEATHAFASHPRLEMDTLCVADLGTWTTLKHVFMGPNVTDDWASFGPRWAGGKAGTGHMMHIPTHIHPVPITPIGSFIAHLTRGLAWEHPFIRNLADYYRGTELLGGGSGSQRLWPSTIYSDATRARVENERPPNEAWCEWGPFFM